MAKTDAAAGNGGQGELDLKVMAEALGMTVDQLVADFIRKAAGDESTRGELLNQTVQISAGMSPEEKVLSNEVATLELHSIRNRAFSDPQPIPDAWLAKMMEWYEAGMMPPATLVTALAWHGLNDKVSTEATFGRFFDGIGNMVTYVSRLANARRRAFIPDAKKFGETTISVNGRIYVGAKIREFLDSLDGITVPKSGSSVSTYLYRAVKDKKVPADTKIHCLGIPGCSSSGVGVDIARYYEWFINHRADVANGIILSKDGEMVEITDYQAEHPPEPEPNGEDDGDDDDDDDGDDT